MGSNQLGRYIPYNSPIHRMDPRFKLISLFLIIVAIFMIKNIAVYGVFSAFILLILIMSKIPLRTFKGFVKSTIFIAIILFLLNTFTVKDAMGHLYWSTWNGKINVSLGTIEATALIFLRIFLMIITTTLLTSTTKPLDLMISLEDILKPLKKVKFPTTTVSMIISIALRFIPTLLADANRIMQAQASRGVDFENGKLKEKFKALVTLVIPLFLSAFSKAYDLADALEARGYNVLSKRTRYRSFFIKFTDILFFIVILFVFIGVILISYFSHDLSSIFHFTFPQWFDNLTPKRR